jgi:hypothetical protein
VSTLLFGAIFAHYHGNDPISPVTREIEQACWPSILSQA